MRRSNYIVSIKGIGSSSLQVELVHQKRGQFIIIDLWVCIPGFGMVRMGNALIGDKIRMGTLKSIADLNRRRRIIRAVKEQDGYGCLWQVGLVESIKIDAAAEAGDTLGNSRDEPWHRTFLRLKSDRRAPIEDRSVEHESLDILGIGGAMLEGLDNRSSLRPAVEDQVVRTVGERVLDASFQILPLGIATMIEIVGAGWG